MKRVTLSVILLISMVVPVWSQNPSKREKIKALFVLMHQDSLIIKTVDATTSAMMKNMTALFSDTNYAKMGIDASQLAQKLTERSMKRSRENALKLLEVDMVDIYEKYFTVEEIDDFSSFYKSRSGQKMLSQMPEITKDIMNVMSAKYQVNFQQVLLKDIQEIIEQLKASKGGLSDGFGLLLRL